MDIVRNHMVYFTETLEGAYLTARNSGYNTDIAMNAMKAKAFDLITEYAEIHGTAKVTNMVACALMQSEIDLDIDA